ncbi:MAG: AEC family transporter, partial [Anaerotignaceae bacterium]
GFIGIPLFHAFYGAQGLFYASVCEIVSDIFAFSLVYILFSGTTGTKAKMELKEIFSPPIIAVIIGFSLFMLRIKLPSFLGDAIESIANASTTIAMFVLGTQVADIKFKEFLGDKKAYIIILMRLLVIPLFAFIVVKVILGDTSLLGTVFVLAWGLPAGVFCLILAEKFETDAQLATKSIMLSNILCLVSIPIWALVV